MQPDQTANAQKGCKSHHGAGRVVRRSLRLTRAKKKLTCCINTVSRYMYRRYICILLQSEDYSHLKNNVTKFRWYTGMYEEQSALQWTKTKAVK